jgi:hypothetical protein
LDYLACIFANLLPLHWKWIYIFQKLNHCWLFGLYHGMYSFRFNVCSGYSLSSFLRSRTNTIVINQTKFWIHTRNKNFDLLYSSHAITEITLVEFCDVDWHEKIDSDKNTTYHTFVLRGGAINWSSKCQPIIALSSIEVGYKASVKATKNTN